MTLLLFLLLAGQEAPLAAPPVGDPVLAEQRGGFTLPNGIDVSLTVQTQTSVDGMVVLRTVFRADQGPASLTVFTPRAGDVPVATGTAAAAARISTAPTIAFDNRGNLLVTPGMTGPSVSVTGGGQGATAVPAGLAAVVPGADGVATAAGLVTHSVRGDVQAIELRGSDLSITHLAGSAFGSAIANSGSDRVIDTQTSVSIDLANAGPDVLGSAMFRVQDIALDAVAMRAQ